VMRPTLSCLALVLLAAPLWAAGDVNLCDVPGEAPDVILGDLQGVSRLGAVDGIAAFSVGSTECNLGTCWLDYFAATARHPVFTMNLHRIENGRFRQLGMGWAVHRYLALSSPVCSTACEPTSGTHLGVACSTTDSSSINGAQFRAGPRSEIDASDGSFPFPATDLNTEGDAIYKRLQVAESELDPALHPGARYFLEGQLVAPDDAEFGNGANNVSFLEVAAVPLGEGFTLVPVGQATVGKTALSEWSAEPGVVTSTLDLPGDGRILVASQVSELGAGRRRYDYVIQNVNSQRAVRSLSIPLPVQADAGAFEFGDVDYHSGDPVDGTDWQVSAGGPGFPRAVVWQTPAFEADPSANAVRWGTAYGFAFETDAPATAGAVTLEYFRPGAPGGATAAAVVPLLCDADGVCGALEDPCACPDDCGPAPGSEGSCDDGIDDDCDGRPDCLDVDCCSLGACASVDADGDTALACEDCDDGDGAIWSVPGEAEDLRLRPWGGTVTRLDWLAPADPGATEYAFEVIRSDTAADFVQSAACLAPPSLASEEFDADVPTGGSTFYYLVRAVNACPGGDGTAGSGSAAERIVTDCP